MGIRLYCPEQIYQYVCIVQNKYISMSVCPEQIYQYVCISRTNISVCLYFQNKYISMSVFPEKMNEYAYVSEIYE